MTRLSNRRGHFGKDYVCSLSMPDRYAGIRRVTLSFGYVRKMVVMRAFVRSVANEQVRETRLVMLTRGRFAIRLNPLRVLCAERIVHLSLKLGITRNFRDEEWRARRFHRSVAVFLSKVPSGLLTRRAIFP